VLCLSGTLRRLGVRPAAMGATRFPSPSEPPLSAFGQTPPGSGILERYQVFYRNAAAAFCPPASFNLTNGLQLAW
jgi:hypothetical protein